MSLIRSNRGRRSTVAGSWIRGTAEAGEVATGVVTVRTAAEGFRILATRAAVIGDRR